MPSLLDAGTAFDGSVAVAGIDVWALGVRGLVVGIGYWRVVLWAAAWRLDVGC